MESCRIRNKGIRGSPLTTYNSYCSSIPEHHVITMTEYTRLCCTSMKSHQRVFLAGVVDICICDVVSLRAVRKPTKSFNFVHM